MTIDDANATVNETAAPDALHQKFDAASFDCWVAVRSIRRSRVSTIRRYHVSTVRCIMLDGWSSEGEVPRWTLSAGTTSAPGAHSEPLNFSQPRKPPRTHVDDESSVDESRPARS